MTRTSLARFTAVAAASLLLTSSVWGTEATAGTINGDLPEDVLILGSSLVRGMKKPLKTFLELDGEKVKIKARGPAKWLLQRHSERPPTAKALQSRDWDFVIMAEQSQGTWAPERYAGASALYDKVVELSNAQPMFVMTWRDRGFPPAAYDGLKGQVGGQVGYVPLAAMLDVPVAPAGWAFRNSIALDELPYDLWKDGHHLNTRGKYLVALVVFSVMTGQSPIGLPPQKKLAVGEAAYLQALAEATIADNAGEWNLDSNGALP